MTFQLSPAPSEIGSANWPVVCLQDIVDILDSKRVPVNRDERAIRIGEVPYYGATGQVGWIDDYLFDEELVLLGEDGAPFLERSRPKAYLIRGKSWVNNHAHVLRARSNIDSRFLLHALNMADYRPYVSGTTRLKLPQGPMRTIPIPLPPLAEQKEIVAAIETQFARLDDAVAALERARTRLKRYRASVLKAACEGRLVPTEAELARQEGRPYEPATCLLERIKASRTVNGGKGAKARDVATSSLSDLPCLPDGWAWSTLSDLATRIGDVDHRMPKAQDTGVPYISTKDFQPNGSIDFEGAKKISRTDFDALCRKIRPNKGDILLSRYGTVGEVRAVQTDIDFQASYSVAIIKMPREFELTSYLSLFLRADFAQQQIRSHIRASSQPDVGLESIRGLHVAVPPIDEQCRIITETDRRISVLDRMEAEVTANLKRAQSLRQSILRRAFSGELGSLAKQRI